MAAAAGLCSDAACHVATKTSRLPPPHRARIYAQPSIGDPPLLEYGDFNPILPFLEGRSDAACRVATNAPAPTVDGQRAGKSSRKPRRPRPYSRHLRGYHCDPNVVPLPPLCAYRAPRMPPPMSRVDSIATRRGKGGHSLRSAPPLPRAQWPISKIDRNVIPCCSLTETPHRYGLREIELRD